MRRARADTSGNSEFREFLGADRLRALVHVKRWFPRADTLLRAAQLDDDVPALRDHVDARAPLCELVGVCVGIDPSAEVVDDDRDVGLCLCQPRQVAQTFAVRRIVVEAQVMFGEHRIAVEEGAFEIARYHRCGCRESTAMPRDAREAPVRRLCRRADRPR